MATPVNQYPVLIQTQFGNVPINCIEPGHVLYSYDSGEELEVQAVINRDTNIYLVTYNDGRYSYYTEGELENLKKLVLAQHMIDYNQDKIIPTLDKDPYVAGALLVFGDQDDKYLNLPFDVQAINSMLGNKYQLVYANGTSAKGKKYFRYRGSSPDSKITWEEFFPNYIFHANPQGEGNAPLIPIEYQRASIKDRLKFIRGAFDIGYNQAMFPEECGVAHTSKPPLIELQRVLWSLGLLSSLEYDERVTCNMEVDKITTEYDIVPSYGSGILANIHFKFPQSYDGRDDRLYIVGKQSVYPGYFYNIETIEEMINSKLKSKEYLKFKLQIASIKPYTKGTATNILLNKQFVPYLTADFLPKISARK